MSRTLLSLIFCLSLTACAARGPAEPEPTPEPPPPTLIHVEVVPEGAKVTVDGLAIDQGVDFEIAPGDHTVQVERQGFEPLEQAVSVDEGTREALSLKLTGLPQKLTLTSYPARASLTLRRGDEVLAEGPAPLEVELTSGAVTLTASLDGFESVERSLFVDSETTWEECMDPPGQLLDCRWAAPSVRSPKGAAFSPDSTEVWTAQLNRTPSLRVYDVATGTEQAEITLGEDGAVELEFSQDGSRLYASQMDTARVYEVDPEKREVLRHFSTKSRWTKVVELSADGKKLYASNWLGNDVSEVDIEQGKTLRKLKTVKTPRGLWATPDGASLYVAGFGDGRLDRIDLESGARTKIFQGGVLRHLEADEERGRVYISDMRRSVIWVMDTKTEEVTKLAKVEKLPNTIALTPDGRVLFVSCRGRNGKNWMAKGPEWGSIFALDALTGEVLDVVVAGNQPTALDVSSDGRFMVFSDILDNRIRLYEIPPYEELAAGGGGLRDVYKERLRK